LTIAHEMKISRPDPESTPGPGESSGVVPAGANAASRQSAPSAPSDRVQLSNLSGYLASALSGSPAHVAKINELNAAVSGGRYRVDANTLSGSIIQHTIEFGLGQLLVAR
jgi:flagellar biosynthesis anti-sigma factor FlgM